MEIRKMVTKDIESTVELWYETSVLAHDFISADYWEKNKQDMATLYLPNAETYLAVENERIVGFIAMKESYLAALFVDNKMQGEGIGKKLLNHIKEKRTTIQLKVYKKNTGSIAFYKNQDFKVISENREEATGEKEFAMEWERKDN